MDKVINPNSGKPITIGGKIYNDLIDQGYVLKKGELIKPKTKIRKEETQPLESESKRPQFHPYDNKIEYYALPNVRCIECNLPVTKYNRYKELLQTGMKPIEVYELLNIKRVCCRKEYSQAHLEPFPNINQSLIDDEPITRTLKKNPKLNKVVKSDIIRLYEHDKLVGLKTRIDSEEGVSYGNINPYKLKTTPIANNKYYISSAK